MKITAPAQAFIFGMLALTARAQQNSPEEFLATYRAAIEERSPEKFESITYSEGMSEEDRKLGDCMEQVMLSTFAATPVERITLEPLGEDFRPIIIARGKKYEPTYPPVGQIKIHYQQTDENSPKWTMTPYAVINGKYFIISTKSTDLNWKGPPDKTLTFMLMGTGADKAVIKAKWNASGVNQEDTFKVPSSNFLGQYFDEITATCPEDNTDVTLTVMENSREIYTSGTLQGKGTLEYKREHR